MASLTLKEGLQLAWEYLDKGDLKQACELSLRISNSCPPSAEIRSLLQRCVQQLPVVDRELLVRSLIAFLGETTNFVADASIGWQYSCLFDERFVSDGFLRAEQRSPSKTLDSSRLASRFDASTPDEILGGLARSPNAAALFEELQSLTASNCDSLVSDGAEEKSRDARGIQASLESFTPHRLNVLILGAGCTGLTLGNILKASFGDRVDVLTIENRVSQPGCKRPYSRNWLTNISLACLDGLLDQRILRILATVGDRGYAGASLKVIESLLLLSNKSLGCRFHFEENVDASALRHSEAHLVVDATGGRLSPPTTEMALRAAPQSIHPIECEYSRLLGGFINFGIRRSPPENPPSVDIARYGNVLVPLLRGKPIQVPMFKITNLPAAAYQSLLSEVVRWNNDCRFYVWPGTLKQDFNQMLVIVNLLKHEFENMANIITSPVSLVNFSGVIEKIGFEDGRIAKVVDHLCRELPRDLLALATIEPPFVYRPYLQPLSPSGEELHGKPLVRVGDSIFNGNPKTGNGLARHLAHLGKVQDYLLKAYLQLASY